MQEEVIMKRGVDDGRNDDLASLHRSEALRKTSIPGLNTVCFTPICTLPFPWIK